jgi:hypothetical protein
MVAQSGDHGTRRRYHPPPREVNNSKREHATADCCRAWFGAVHASGKNLTTVYHAKPATTTAQTRLAKDGQWPGGYGGRSAAPAVTKNASGFPKNRRGHIWNQRLHRSKPDSPASWATFDEPPITNTRRNSNRVISGRTDATPDATRVPSLLCPLASDCPRTARMAKVNCSACELTHSNMYVQGFINSRAVDPLAHIPGRIRKR